MDDHWSNAVVGDRVKYCRELGVFVGAEVRGTKANPNGHANIRHAGTVHIKPDDGPIVFGIEPAGDNGEHGPGEYCFQPIDDHTNCRLPGT